MQTQQFQVEGMSCQHCVQSVREAIEEVDPQARVEVDLPRGQVQVSAAADRAALAQAITEAGYRVL